MSVLFDNVKPGDTVHYRTPQGVTAKGKVVMNRGTHLVLNRGRGSPQVVTDKNYVKHERSGKTVGALLSRLSVKSEETVNELDNKTLLSYAKKARRQGGGNQYLDVLSLNPKDKAQAEKRTKGLAAVSRALGRNFKAGKAPIEEEVRSPSDAEYAVAKKFMKSKRNADDLELAGLGVHKKTGNIHVHIMTKDGKGMGSHHVISPEGKELKEATWQGAEDPYNWDPVLRKQIFDAAAKKNREKQIAKGQPVPHKLDSGRALKSSPAPFRRGIKEGLVDTIKSKLGMKPGVSTGMPATGRPGMAVKRNAMGGYHAKNKKGEERKFSDREAASKWLQSEETLEEGNIPKVQGLENFKTMAHDWAYYNDHHNGGKPLLIQKTTETNKVHHQTISIGHHPRSGNQYVIGVFNHTGGPNSEEGFGTHHHHTQGLEMDEDSHDAEGAAERVAKTKKHKKKLHEVSTGTLASYVSKAIADRKKAQGGADMARRIHTPDRAAYFVDKMAKRAAKRSTGIKTAVAKIAKAYEETSIDEAKKSKAPKAVNWQSIETKNFSVYKSTEGGMPLKHHMARLAAAGIPSRKSHSPYVGHTALEIPAKHERKASKILYGENVYIDEQPINEARENEWAANQALAGNVNKPAKGHYLMRDGRRLSGPHSPEDAVREYKKMSDSKGVKIVHVKEAEDKYKKAVDKALNLKKKAKGNKHVDTEPKLDMIDKGTNSPIEDSHGEQNAAKL